MREPGVSRGTIVVRGRTLELPLYEPGDRVVVRLRRSGVSGAATVVGVNIGELHDRRLCIWMDLPAPGGSFYCSFGAVRPMHVIEQLADLA